MLRIKNKTTRIEYYSSEAIIEVVAIAKPSFVSTMKSVFIGR
ncbi:MAG: hypothetical protein WCP56_01085 [Candidatus Saccharibacteria bacterium]|jgi:hypothetical protein|nr:hypothetical protein [Patescibacteria group bacterium]